MGIVKYCMFTLYGTCSKNTVMRVRSNYSQESFIFVGKMTTVLIAVVGHYITSCL